MTPTIESVRDKLARPGSLFARDEVEVLVQLLAAAERLCATQKEALEQIAEGFGGRAFARAALRLGEPDGQTS
jgi:predicted hotdog family 3-hydroxylacyl-ACP dehydratase